MVSSTFVLPTPPLGQRNARLPAGLLAAGLALAGNTALAADPSLENLTSELVDLRGEVQELHTELDQARESHRNRMQSLERQRGELEAEVRREELRVSKLEKDLSKLREQAALVGAEAERLEPAVLAAIDATRTWIAAGLPFKPSQRAAELDDLERQVRQGNLSSHNAARRLWAFHEDELRLTSENGIYRQPVRIRDEEVLADVARLGMVMLFFETSDERYGQASRTDDGWRFQVYEDRASAERVAELFENFQKQVRTGYFELPNALPESGERR